MNETLLHKKSTSIASNFLWLGKEGFANISYKALFSILNSKFIGWYFRKKFQISNEDTFPQIMIRDILQFAIPKTTAF